MWASAFKALWHTQGRAVSRKAFWLLRLTQLNLIAHIVACCAQPHPTEACSLQPALVVCDECLAWAVLDSDSLGLATEASPLLQIS